MYNILPFPQSHVHLHNKFKDLTGYVQTRAGTRPPDGNYGIYAVDCEMVSDFILLVWYPTQHSCSNKHIEAETTWPPFLRGHVQMHFLEWKCIIFNWNFTEKFSRGPIDNIPALVQIMPWYRPHQATSHFLNQWCIDPYELIWSIITRQCLKLESDKRRLHHVWIRLWMTKRHTIPLPLGHAW